MPTAKGKGGSASHRYRPASEYDDATLAQKREYWRTKKREQRARLSEQRAKPRQGSLNAPPVVNSSLSGSFAVPLFQSNDESHRTANVSASQSGNTVGDSSLDVSERHKEKWFQTMKLNKVLPASCTTSAKTAGGNTVTVKCLKQSGAVNRAVTSPTRSGNQLASNTSSSVPPVRVTGITNGSSTKTTSQPCVSMQGISVPKMQHKAHVPLSTQPKRLPTNVTTGIILVASPCGSISVKTEGKSANNTPLIEKKNALVTKQRAQGVSNSQLSLMSEEEKAAKRREHWRIKKREQRARLAAQLDKAKRTVMTVQMQTAQKIGLLGDTNLQHLPSHSFFRGAEQKQCPTQVKTSFTSTKRENDKLQSGAAGLASINQEALQIKVQNRHGNTFQTQTTQAAITSDNICGKKPGAPQRKFPSFVHLSNITRGIARCKTPRQRFIEAQKNLMNQRNIRCKSLLLASVFGTRHIPRINASDTPEEVIAKRREYWRIKKREQRAKLSMEVKARLKEKDSLMRRVKRYQKILEDMRKARALTQSPGNTLNHASEAIGGFIKEDGTVTINIPQGVTDHTTAAQKSKEERHVGSTTIPIIQPQHHPNRKKRCIRINQPLPPLHPAQVKVSFPLAGQSANKPPRLLSIRPRAQNESTTAPNSQTIQTIQTIGQLTLTHPQTAISGGSVAGSNLGGCVMKMAVSSTASSLSAFSLDAELTEEERMAKKREYWRIKKREQRAARAARLKQGVLQARANVALQRRKVQKQVALGTVALSRRLTNHAGNTQPPPNNSVPVMLHAKEIKQESEYMPAVDLNSKPEQAICHNIKPPASPPSPPEPQPESDPSLNTDSQATTLLAVASMKKLLEESLSTVTETNIKIETKEEPLEEQIKPNSPQLFLRKDELAPVAADLMLHIKSWQTDDDSLAPAGSPSPHFKDSPQITEIHSPLHSDVALNSTCDHSSQTTSNFIVNPSVEASDNPSSPFRTLSLCAKKAGHQNCSSPEPPKLHHLPLDQVLPQQQDCEKLCQTQEQCHSNLPPTQRHCSVVTEQSGLTSLQRKREYWKLMKRQQRARSKARHKETQGEWRSLLSSRNIQAPHSVTVSTGKSVNPLENLSLQAKSSVVSLNAVTSIPTTCNVQSLDNFQVKLPITSVYSSPRSEQSNTGPLQIVSDYHRTTEGQHQAMPALRKWMSRSTDVDLSTSLPALKPPDNPLSSINLQPIEPPVEAPNSALNPIKIPCASLQSPTHIIQSPLKLAPVSTMVPPKPIPGEPEEDFQRRKREYWRIKKKEQRARKAICDKAITPTRTSNILRPILPAHDLETQDCGQWVNSAEESQHLISTSVETDLGSFPYPNYTAPLEDESELLFPDYGHNGGEDGQVTDAMWRNHYLMDYDPLNQLLVCMVCGELQYSHSLEGVRAHIDEAHPHTLSLEPGERQQILEAWDEQVSQRERFFTSQLQQHSGSLAEAHRN
ncbi:uncharacterized protein LOC113125638 [Mastacembelus armatus]|uniref:uncharacterized protein LOC113125638 n=1 Tax=Mastacembelus armatus TaxID=205130 RepID=UPI000E4634E1|nr:uncharacterized protein LOC113125638 [Mastacembelus armatus]